VLVDLALIALGALLFALSFPSFLSNWGWFPLAYVAPRRFRGHPPHRLAGR
jgi:hypothetical protein